ncbi:VanZ family protein [Psychrobacillus sp. NEAU-3TGS]|uniref:VanZ family protein n=1 Tax=Psychrobacillus sp. NEAU-3TGS TaxID=2995412 RepID=UPI00249842A2|nr:VanZ family protein [Psychrobacillus sp. NEAU-3TGS]MDI2585881.1 VanZ family protein [Psychrobacillus sp. NEAU-3TGS]
MKKIIPLLFLLIVVFISSGQTAEQQSLIPVLEKWLPGKPLESFLSLFQIPYWGILVSIEERGYYAFVEFLIRKGTHFLYFGVIALAIFAALPTRKFRTITAIVLTMLFAVADELHQSFTSGRTASAQDVILDTAGAITALLLLTYVRRKRRKSAKS